MSLINVFSAGDVTAFCNQQYVHSGLFVILLKLKIYQANSPFRSMSILVNIPAREKPTIIPACAVHAVTPERFKLIIGTLNQVIVSNAFT